MNEKNTPTKPPHTTSKSKEYANQNNKNAILIKRLRQPKYQICTSSEWKCEFVFENIDLRCFVAGQILLQIFVLPSVKLPHLKLQLCKKTWQISGMPKPNIKPI